MANFTLSNISLIQKILGKHYKWWFIFTFYFKKSLIYRLNYIAMIVRYLITFLIFSLIIYLKGGKESFDYYVLSMTLYYFFVVFNNTSFEMKDGVLFGKYTNHFLLPINMHLRFYVQSFGMLLFPFLIRFLISMLIILLFNIQIIFGLYLIIGVLFSVIFTVSIGNFWQTIIGSTSFYLPDNKYILMGSDDLIQFLTGAILPLVGALSFLQFTPWSFIIHHPMQIYFGNYSNLEILYVFLGGLCWSAILYFVSKLVFKIGLNKNEAIGL